MPTWNDAIEDYKRAEGALRRTDRIAYMRHIRPFLEKIAYLLVECMMPDELFRKIMNHEAYIILTETVPLIRDKVGARISKGHELFSFIQAGYFFTHAVACADPNSMESRIRKRLHSFGESLYLAYCTASEVAMHSQTMDIDVAINQSHIDYLIRTLFDYLEKLRLAALPHYLLRILHIQPLKNRYETPLKQWLPIGSGCLQRFPTPCPKISRGIPSSRIRSWNRWSSLRNVTWCCWVIVVRVRRWLPSIKPTNGRIWGNGSPTLLAPVTS